VTEALKSVPGFWVESSGGEASGNVRARGVPVDGFGSVQLLEDGIPVQHDPALGYLNADQVFRLDETIERIEVVRGGPASLFYSNAPAGAINFIPRQVGNHAEGLVKMTLGADSLYRADFWVGAPVGDWKLAVGGFYRSEGGVRDPGFTGNRGGQIRATVSREWSNAKFSFDVKRLDDIVAFYTGIPMRTYPDGQIRAVPGFNGHSGTVAGPETQLIKMQQGDGSTYTFDNSLGTQVKRTQLTAKFEIEPVDGWKISNTSRYNDSNTQRNGVYPNTLQSASSLLSSNASLLAQAPGASALQLRYTNGGQVFDTANQNGNGLVIVGGLRGLTLPVKEFMSDTHAAHRFRMGSTTHDITLGYYFAHIDEDFSRYSSTALLDVQDNAQLLNLVAVDTAGNVVKSFSDTNGIYKYGYEWESAHGEQTTNALYLSDEWQITHKLRLDGGVRWETMRARHGGAEEDGQSGHARHLLDPDRQRAFGQLRQHLQPCHGDGGAELPVRPACRHVRPLHLCQPHAQPWQLRDQPDRHAAHPDDGSGRGGREIHQPAAGYLRDRLLDEVQQRLLHQLPLRSEHRLLGDRGAQCQHPDLRAGAGKHAAPGALLRHFGNGDAAGSALQGAGLHRCFGQGEQLRRQAPDPRPHRQSAHRARLQPAA
jgi:outer membrane receptor protein involved in Fe transport